MHGQAADTSRSRLRDRETALALAEMREYRLQVQRQWSAISNASEPLATVTQCRVPQ
jgi:hypothetical protein